MNPKDIFSSSQYSQKTITAASNKNYMGRLEKADAYGRTKCDCADDLEMWLNFNEHEKVREASYLTEGCLSTVACGSAVCSLAIGKDLKGLMAITSQDVNKELDGLPQDSQHTIKIALEALHACVADYITLRRERWRKGYRRRSV